MSENEYYPEDDYGGDVADDGSGGGGEGMPEDHWVHNEEAVQWADQFMQTLMTDPAAIEAWYAEYSKSAGLRGLAEAAAEGAKRIDDPRVRDQALAILRQSREERGD